MMDERSLAEKARKYLERRQQREIEKVLLEEEQISKQIQNKPIINPNSERLAKERGRTDDVGLALYAHAEMQRATRDFIEEEERMVGSQLARPAITKLAAELVREGNISDRLYSDAQNKKKFASEPPEPKSVSRSGHVDQLYGKAKEMRMARDKAQEEMKEQIRRAANQPKLSSKSRKLVEGLGQSSSERLFQHKPKKKAVPEPELPSFQPKINPVSEKLAEQTKTGAVTHERLYKEHEARTERRKVLFENKTLNEKDMQECTFKPSINSSIHCQESVVDRLTEWNNRKSQRMAEQQKLKATEEQEREKCTFAPKINAGPSSALKKKEANGSRGFDVYVERQKKAREEKERLKSAVDTSSWTNKITVPIAPTLGTANRIRHQESVKKVPRQKEAAEQKLLAQQKLPTNAQKQPQRPPPPVPLGSPKETLNEFKLLSGLLS